MVCGIAVRTGLAGLLAICIAGPAYSAEPLSPDDLQAYADYMELRDCSAFSAAAAVIYGWEGKEDSDQFRYFLRAAETGEAKALAMIDSGLKTPSGQLQTRGDLEAVWESKISGYIDYLRMDEADLEFDEDPWESASLCASRLLR